MGDQGAPRRTAGAEPLRVTRVRPAYQQVADQLRELILGGTLTSGDRLPNETNLAASFGVSRSTVREAIRVLSSTGLVYTLRGTTGGTFVSRICAEDVTDYLETSIGLMSGADDVTLDELVEARFALEVPAAQLAAVRRDDTALGLLRGAVEREASLTDARGRYAEQRTFHSALVAASGNEVLRVMAEPVFAVLVSYLRPTDVSTRELTALQQDHVEIADRVERQDGEGAAEAMRRHLERLARLYRQQ